MHPCQLLASCSAHLRARGGCQELRSSLLSARGCALQAYKLTPNAALPLLGLAQMNLLQKENTNAISLLEQALQYVPGWNDALMVSPPPPPPPPLTTWNFMHVLPVEGGAASIVLPCAPIISRLVCQLQE